MSDKPCFLNLIVRDVSKNQKSQSNNNNLRDVSIGMQLQVGESLIGSPLLALIQTAASNLVHSLSNDIGTLLTATPPNTENDTVVIDGVPRDATWLEQNAKDFGMWEKELSANLTEEISKLNVNLWTDPNQTNLTNAALIDSAENTNHSLDSRDNNEAPIIPEKDKTIDNNALVNVIWTSPINSNPESAQDILSSAIQSWSTKFSGRGAGLSVSNTPVGVDISFTIAENTILHVSSHITAAVNNLMKSLKKELDSLILDFSGAVVSPPPTVIEESNNGPVFEIPVDDINAVSSAMNAIDKSGVASSSASEPVAKDPRTLQRAREELNRIIQNSKMQGFLSVVKQLNQSTTTSSPSSNGKNEVVMGNGTEIFSKGRELRSTQGGVF
eukprot:gene33303-43058_t